VTLTVTDENGCTDTDTADVAVTVIPIELTSITVLPETMTLFVGGDDTVTSITASYNYGPDASIALAACSYSWNTGGIASVLVGVVTGVAEGSDTLTVSYTEGTITETDTVAVTVVADVLISPSTITVTAGDPFTIDIVVENVTELQGVTVELAFDDSKITYTSAAVGTFLHEPILLYPPPVGSVTNEGFSIVGTGIPNYVSGSGTVLTVTFNALVPGTTDISFYLTELRHDVFTLIPHKVKGECSVTVN